MFPEQVFESLLGRRGFLRSGPDGELKEAKSVANHPLVGENFQPVPGQFPFRAVNGAQWTQP